MSINQIAVYTDGTWDPHDIGAKASNVTLNSQINGSNNVEGALGILPSNTFNNNSDNNKILIANQGKIGVSNINVLTLNDSVTALNNSVGNAIKNITRNGTTFTATRLDGTTFTFTQQDNNTMRDPATATPIAIGIGGTAAVGNSSKYAKEDHKHIISASPNFTSPTATTMPAIGISSNALINAKYIYELWYNTHYKAGDPLNNYTLDCFGWLTGGQTIAYLDCMLPKSIMKPDGTYLNFTITAIQLAIRGGKAYLGGSEYVNGLSFVTAWRSNRLAITDKYNVLTIGLKNANKFSNIENNSPLCGNIKITGKFS